ncbi:MAG: hypothetical protein SNJ77_05460 [Cytophagales bacterium]
MFDLLMSLNTDSCNGQIKYEINYNKAIAKFNLNSSDLTVLDLELDSLNQKHEALKAVILCNNDKWAERKTDFINSETETFFLIVSVANSVQKRDFNEAISYAQKIDSSSLNNLIFLKKIDKSIQEYQKKNKRSLTRALIVSAIIPGLGKKYYGKAGEAVYLMMSNGVFAGLFLEAAIRKGLLSVFSLTYAGAFLTFYGGNLVGTYNAYKRTELAKKRKLKNECSEALNGWFLANFK